MSTRFKAYLFLLTTAVIWGAAGPVIKFTLAGIEPLPFLAYRFAISAVFSIFFFSAKIAQGKKFRNLKANFPLALLYGFLAVPLALSLLFFGLEKSTVLDSTLITIAGPIIVTLGAVHFFRDHITKREKLGIMIVLLGVILNSLLPIFQGGQGIRLTGNLLLLVYLLADSGSVLLAKKAIKNKTKSANLTSLAFIVGAVCLIPLTILIYGWENLLTTILTLPLKYHFGVWYMALLSGNLAYFMYVRGQRSIEVSEAVLFNYLIPLFSVPLAVFWLGESLSLSFILGAIIIATGVYIAEKKKH
ncbi:hypothetical protein A2803_01790 [Candidatus Woesebacteria bacterium RIFCSPHIGHO2_01_FULL_44_21]|uniref:EamA domain-containing protein n=1 Tax=Candidatus Woesebacteria bacterium RIFCSPHIGHO2_01_FULL_44_21 TaxID=1802503 RepID=A0A1F7YVB4_9BACT|nr:MAG: hypothetical protein A2803_01790 [Candidatus Woesebacteria bacterium RIFCSPHIGHO2_01_FULL_44_21]OGM69604.1 MAG: hypothetical protein A2897_03305 [Candidatus Woesebacteria bacterium RIFCSPLOWO2_01_FULL_44_24b]